MHKFVLMFLLLSVSLFAQSITVAVAANVSYAMNELKTEFLKEHPQTQLRIVLGSSGKLTAQIRQGAPYGLFLSANMKYPNALYKDGLALTQPKVYAQGALALFSAKPRDFSKGIRLLKDMNIHKIALANVKTAPYGAAALQAITHADLQQLKPKFVYAESISQVVSYVLSAADIGLIAKSSLYSKKMKAYKENINWIGVDTNLYTPIKQGIVLLKYSKNKKEYQAFYDFILGSKAQAILQRYGYTI